MSSSYTHIGLKHCRVSCMWNNTIFSVSFCVVKFDFRLVINNTHNKWRPVERSRGDTDLCVWQTLCVFPLIVVASVKVMYTGCVVQLRPLEYFRYCLLHYSFMHFLCIHLWLISWWFAWAQTFIYRLTLYQSLNNELRFATKEMFFHDLKSLTFTVHFMLSLPTFFSSCVCARACVCVCGLCSALGHRRFAAGGREVPRSVQTGSDAFP